ncbi:uncharacterized protein [Apostichopus japonicus]|uniref:uncharacterized protein isoform X2 n=1 Tax=Stichopus japonicus TaxID=307972 RepID=UPI003AB21DC0
MFESSFEPPVSLDDPRCQPEYFEDNFPCQNCFCSENGEYFDCCRRSSAMRPQVRDSDNCALVFDSEECTWSLTPSSTDNQEACDVVGMVG